MAEDDESPAQMGELDVLVLMQMAKMGAVGTHTVSDFDIKQRLPSVDFDQLSNQLQKLAKRLLITRRVESGQIRLSLTPLGTAIARELDAVQLSKLSDKQEL